MSGLIPPVPKSQKVIDLALSPACVLGCKGIDAGIDADVADKKLWALNQVRYLVFGPFAETTCRHRRSP
jgi:hypothetical protein